MAHLSIDYIPGSISSDPNETLHNEAYIALADGFNRFFIQHIFMVQFIFKDRFFISFVNMPEHNRFGEDINFKGAGHRNVIWHKLNEISLGYRFRLNPDDRGL